MPGACWASPALGDPQAGSLDVGAFQHSGELGGSGGWWPVSLALCREGTDFLLKPDPSVACECLALGRLNTKGFIDGGCPRWRQA